MNPNEEHVARYGALLAEALANCREDVFTLAIPDDATNFALSIVYATILEQAADCQLLLDAHRTAAAGAVLRSIVESFADLNALIRTPDYVERMVATVNWEKRRLLREVAEAPDADHLRGIAGGLNAGAELAKVEALLADSRERGHLRLRNRDRFEAAGLLNVHATMYWHLCLSAHNVILALEGRHVEQLAEGYRLIAFREPAPSELALYYEATLMFVLDATLLVFAHLKVKRVGYYERVGEALNALRAEIKAAPVPTTEASR